MELKKLEELLKAPPQHFTIIRSIRNCHQQSNINNGKPKLPHRHSALRRLELQLSHKTQTKQEK